MKFQGRCRKLALIRFISWTLHHWIISPLGGSYKVLWLQLNFVSHSIRQVNHLLSSGCWIWIIRFDLAPVWSNYTPVDSLNNAPTNVFCVWFNSTTNTWKSRFIFHLTPIKASCNFRRTDDTAHEVKSFNLKQLPIKWRKQCLCRFKFRCLNKMWNAARTAFFSSDGAVVLYTPTVAK